MKKKKSSPPKPPKSNRGLQSAGLGFLVALGYLLISNRQPSEKVSETTPVESVNGMPGASIVRLPSSEPEAETPPYDFKPVAQRKSVPKIIASFLPESAAAGAKGLWAHKITFEDDAYVGSQLMYDNKPLENYNYRWLKGSNGEPTELVGGTLPNIAAIKGSFTTTEQSHQIAESTVGADGEVLSVKEVWNLNSDRVLSPQIKVEVVAKSRTQRSAGHEYWFIALNTGRVVKRVEADRY